MNNLISINATNSELAEILESIQHRDQIFTVDRINSVVGKHEELIEAMYRFGAEFIGYQIVAKKKIQMGLIEAYGNRADFRYIRSVDQHVVYSNIPTTVQLDVDSWLSVLMSSIVRDLGDVYTVADVTTEAGINMLDILIYN